MKELLTKTQKRRKQRVETIIAMYCENIANAQSKMALYETIADAVGLSQYTVIKVISKYCRNGKTDRN